MELGATPQVRPVNGRLMTVDETGSGLRVTWRPAHGFFNLSLWRDDRCAETFHLSPDAATNLVGFLFDSLAQSFAPPVLRLVDEPPRRSRMASRLWPRLEGAGLRLARLAQNRQRVSPKR